MKVDLEDLVRDSLREAAGSARLDPHGWVPSTRGEGPRQVQVQVRVPHPARSRVAAVVVAAILIAGIILPLALLSGLGGGDSRPGPGSDGTSVSGSGLHLTIPEGWDGTLLDPAGEGFGTALMAGNLVLPTVDHRNVYGPFSSLDGGRVILLLQEVTVEGLAPAAYPPLVGPVIIETSDVRRFGEGWASMVHSYVHDEFSISGRMFNFSVGFGGEPREALIDEVNEVLATLRVAPLEAPAGYRTYTDLNDGLAVTIPESWRFSEEPTDLIEPQNALAFGSWDFPDGGVCAPFNALDELPADGAFVWLIVYHQTDHPEDFVPRPERFDLRDFTFGETSCEGTPMYQLRFEDDGRFFQWQVAFGPEASEATEADTVAAMDSLEVGGVCDADGDAYAPEVAPASGFSGTETTISGEVPHGEGNEGGLPADPTTWIEVWWNLDAGDDAWSSALPGGEEPIPARPGPALRLGRVGVSGSCTYELTFTVPQAQPDTYPIVVLYGGPDGAGAFKPAHFEVAG